MTNLIVEDAARGDLGVDFATPCYAGDIERCALLRKSLALFAPGAKHHLLVDTEDVPEFRDRFSADRGVTIIPSKELLPAYLERRRRRLGTWMDTVRRRIAWRMHLDHARFNGWKVQQLLKLHYLSNSSSSAVAFLDSDILVVKNLSREDFWVGSSLILLEGEAVNGEDYAFAVTADALMKRTLANCTTFKTYIHQAPRFRASTGKALTTALAKSWSHWEDAFVSSLMPSEYCLLGGVAREIEGYVGYVRMSGPPEEWAYEVRFKGDERQLNDRIRQCLAENGRRKFFLVQSNLRIAETEYIPALSNLLTNLTAQNSPA